MMTKVVRGLAVLLLMVLFTIPAMADEKPWFDMENCAFCKNLLAEEGLMDHITMWEHHKTNNGSVTITVVDEKYVEAYKHAMAMMDEVGKEMEQGKQVYMCGMCEAYGALMMKGAQWEVVESGNVFVTMNYSDDPEVVKEIHAMTDRTKAEMAKLEKMEKHDKEHKH